jgi:predicted TIM-barrel fold metal-dependent hydrolase
MIIDFHTHIFPDKLAAHAMRVLKKNASVSSDCDPTKEDLLRTMDECGVDKAVVLNIVTKESQHEDVLRFAKSTDSDRLIAFGSVMPDSPHALEYIWKASDEGLKGLKFHPALQRIYPAEKKYFPLYDLARALNLIVTFHAGWDPSYPDEINATPQSMKTIADNFPGLRIIAAHMGGMKLAQEVFDDIAGKSDIYMDTAYCDHSWMDKDMLEKIINKHGADKILFASDFPWDSPSRELALIRSLNITEEQKQLILGDNAVRLLGIGQ